MEINGNKKSQKHIKNFSIIYTMNMTEHEFICKKCKYITKNKFDYKKHVNTRKHRLLHSQNVNDTFICETCNKIYKSYSGLWKHSKKCESKHHEEDKKIIKNQKEQIDELKTMMGSLLEDNKESRDMLKEIIPKMGQSHITNNYNNKISINVFLNTYCKDALSFKEFIDSMQVSLEDLIHTKELGYSKGITNIFMKNLNTLQLNERPIHCSDKKRLQFYVKEQDTWNKDNGDKVKMAISKCHKKQIELIKDWENNNPNWKDDEKKRLEYVMIISEIMGGTNNEQMDKNTKDIIKNISDKILLKDAISEV